MSNWRTTALPIQINWCMEAERLAALMTPKNAMASPLSLPRPLSLSLIDLKDGWQTAASPPRRVDRKEDHGHWAAPSEDAVTNDVQDWTLFRIASTAGRSQQQRPSYFRY